MARSALQFLLYCALITHFIGCRKDEIVLQIDSTSNESTSLTSSLAGTYVGQRFLKTIIEDCVESGGEDCFNCSYTYEYDTIDVEFVVTALNDSVIHVVDLNSSANDWNFELDENYFFETSSSEFSGYYNHQMFQFNPVDSGITMAIDHIESFCESWNIYRTFKMQKQ